MGRSLEMKQKTPDVVNLIIPVKSILALRKAIMSMKDVGALISLRTRGQDVLEISVMDHSVCSAMYAHIPVKPFKGSAWVNIASSKLNELASKLKSYPNAITLKIICMHNMLMSDAITKLPILGVLKSRSSQPNSVLPIDLESYYIIPFLSSNLLEIFLNLSVGSAVVTAQLQSDGQLSLWNSCEYGNTLIEKQLSGFSKKNADVVALATSAEELCKLKCVIKFVKQIVNPLVNSSTDHCVLCFPKRSNLPLVLQFLLSQDIHQHFLMFPFKKPLKHCQIEGNYQSSIQISFEHFFTYSQDIKASIAIFDSVSKKRNRSSSKCKKNGVKTRHCKKNV